MRLLAALAFNNRRLQVGFLFDLVVLLWKLIIFLFIVTKEQIRKLEKIEPIIGFMKAKNFLIQEYAVRALLTFIANDHKNKEMVRSSRGRRSR